MMISVGIAKTRLRAEKRSKVAKKIVKISIDNKKEREREREREEKED